jgi:hypothetical protein
LIERDEKAEEERRTTVIGVVSSDTDLRDTVVD